MTGSNQIRHNFKETEIGWIPGYWNISKLSDIAKVIVSNVDKKVEENEMQVLLCNYLDVYQNDYITSDLDFMRASASKAEVCARKGCQGSLDKNGKKIILDK